MQIFARIMVHPHSGINMHQYIGKSKFAKAISNGLTHTWEDLEEYYKQTASLKLLFLEIGYSYLESKIVNDGAMLFFKKSNTSHNLLPNVVETSINDFKNTCDKIIEAKSKIVDAECNQGVLDNQSLLLADLKMKGQLKKIENIIRKMDKLGVKELVLNTDANNEIKIGVPKINDLKEYKYITGKKAKKVLSITSSNIRLTARLAIGMGFTPTSLPSKAVQKLFTLNVEKSAVIEIAEDGISSNFLCFDDEQDLFSEGDD